MDTGGLIIPRKCHRCAQGAKSSKRPLTLYELATKRFSDVGGRCSRLVLAGLIGGWQDFSLAEAERTGSDTLRKAAL